MCCSIQPLKSQANSLEKLIAAGGGGGGRVVVGGGGGSVVGVRVNVNKELKFLSSQVKSNFIQY